MSGRIIGAFDFMNSADSSIRAGINSLSECDWVRACMMSLA